MDEPDDLTSKHEKRELIENEAGSLYKLLVVQGGKRGQLISLIGLSFETSS